MKIAIIGSGIAGLAAARRLQKEGYDFTVYEANSHIGGHVQTVPVPIGDKVLPIEMGVFMHDPVLIHPHLHECTESLGIPIETFPLTFSFCDHRNHVSWNIETGTPGLRRDLSLLFKAIRHGASRGHIFRNSRYMFELRHFVRDMPRVCESEKYRDVSLQDYLQEMSHSKLFLESWMLPQLMCWWGATGESALSSSIQVVMESMLLVSRASQYIFSKGWGSFIDKVAEPFQDKIKTQCPVEAILKHEHGVTVVACGQKHEYDAAIFATPPNVCSDLIQNKTNQQARILDSFDTTSTQVFMHKDTSWMPKNSPWSLINLINDERGSICTVWYGLLYPEQPNIFVSWGDQLTEVPESSQTVLTADMLRTLPTMNYTHACKEIDSIQGKDSLWYCGAHVHALTGHRIPSLWHDNALMSGLNVAKRATR